MSGNNVNDNLDSPEHTTDISENFQFSENFPYQRYFEQITDARQTSSTMWGPILVPYDMYQDLESSANAMTTTTVNEALPPEVIPAINPLDFRVTEETELRRKGDEIPNLGPMAIPHSTQPPQGEARVLDRLPTEASTLAFLQELVREFGLLQDKARFIPDCTKALKYCLDLYSRVRPDDPQNVGRVWWIERLGASVSEQRGTHGSHYGLDELAGRMLYLLRERQRKAGRPTDTEIASRLDSIEYWMKSMLTSRSQRD